MTGCIIWQRSGSGENYERNYPYDYGQYDQRLHPKVSAYLFATNPDVEPVSAVI